MTEPNTYAIELKGNVGSRSLRPLLDDFSLTETPIGATRLVGVIRDTAQMHGLLAHLISMNVEILAIAPILPAAPPRAHNTTGS